MDKPACGVNRHAWKLAQFLSTLRCNGILLGYYYFSCTIMGVCCILADAFLITSSYMHWVIFLFRLSSQIFPDYISFLFFSVAVHAIGNNECNTFCIVRQWTLAAAAIFRIRFFRYYLAPVVPTRICSVLFLQKAAGISDSEHETIKLSWNCRYAQEFTLNWNCSFHSVVHWEIEKLAFYLKKLEYVKRYLHIL